MDDVGDRAAGRELLRARDHDAVVALLDDAGVERRIALLVRGLAAVDLRWDDRVAGIDVVVAHVLVVGDDVIGELPVSADHEDVRRRRIAGKEAGNVVGRAAHQPEGRFRTGLVEQPPRAQVGMAMRNLPGAPDRLPRLGRREGHALAVLGRCRDVEEPRDRARRLAERRVRRHVLDLLAIDEDLPPVIERTEILCAGSQRAGCGGPAGMNLGLRSHHISSACI